MAENGALIQVDPRSLTLYPTNYNDHPDGQIDELARSLGKFGQYKNIVIWQGAVIAGHGLVKAAIKSNLPTVEARDMSHLTQAEAEALLVADNETARMAVVDYGKLKALVEMAKAAGQTVPGVTEERLREIVEEAKGAGQGGNGRPEPETPTETEAEKLAKKYNCQPGQVWQLGRHTIACIDSTERQRLRGLIGESRVTGIWADPPYGINIVAANGYVGGGEAYDIPFGGRQRQKDLTGRYPIQDWSKNRIDKGLGSVGGAKPFGSKKIRGSVGAANLIPVGKYFPVIGDDTTETAKNSVCLLLELYPDACHIWWGGNYYTDVLPPSAGWIVWDKDNTGNFADCEMAWTNQKRAARIFEHRWNGMLKASEQGQRRVHPTQKPIALAEEIFREYGKPDDLIFDPFLGSGISVLAAEQLNDGRRVIGCELAPEYIAVTIYRWQQLTKQEPRLL